MTQTFDWNPDDSRRVLSRMGRADASTPVVVRPEDLRQGCMGALVAAEFLAAQAGVVPFVTTDDGARGVLTIGGARSKIASAPPEVRTVYLAAHGAARRVATQSTPVPASELDPDLYRGAIGALPIAGVVVLVVLGVAALCALAYVGEVAVRAHGEQAEELARIDTVANLARTELEATGRISPELTDALKPRARAEAMAPIKPLLFGAGAALVIGGGLWLARRR